MTSSVWSFMYNKIFVNYKLHLEKRKGWVIHMGLRNTVLFSSYLVHICSMITVFVSGAFEKWTITVHGSIIVWERTIKNISFFLLWVFKTYSHFSIFTIFSCVFKLQYNLLNLYFLNFCCSQLYMLVFTTIARFFGLFYWLIMFILYILHLFSRMSFHILAREALAKGFKELYNVLLMSI